MRDALGFLTVLPVRAGPLGRRGVALFPVVGAVIGAGWVLAGWVGYHLGGPLVAAALILVVDLLVTGALHLDGLADTADGLASRRPPEQAREVMKDPRIGAVGAATLGTALLLRFALLAALIPALVAAPMWPAELPAGLLWPPGTAPFGLLALAAVPVVGRCALVCLLAGARPRQDSLAAGPVAAAGPAPVAAAIGVSAVLVAVTAGGFQLLAAAAAVATALLVAFGWWRRRLGSAGDTIGAGGMLAELVMTAGLLTLATLGG